MCLHVTRDPRPSNQTPVTRDLVPRLAPRLDTLDWTLDWTLAWTLEWTRDPNPQTLTPNASRLR
eukprot:3009449-Rhodomonas_salina.1